MHSTGPDAAVLGGEVTTLNSDAAGGGIERAECGPLLRHPLPVAVLAAALAVFAFPAYPTAGRAVIAAFMVAVLVVLAATDIERRIIPNRIVLPAAAILLVAHIALAPDRTREFVLASVGAAAAFAIPSLISRRLMGMGDVKLVMLIGAGLGWGVVGAITVAFAVLWPVAVGMMIRGGLAARKATLPFAPFLAIGALTILIVPGFLGVGGI